MLGRYGEGGGCLGGNELSRDGEGGNGRTGVSSGGRGEGGSGLSGAGGFSGGTTSNWGLGLGLGGDSTGGWGLGGKGDDRGTPGGDGEGADGLDGGRRGAGIEEGGSLIGMLSGGGLGCVGDGCRRLGGDGEVGRMSGGNGEGVAGSCSGGRTSGGAGDRVSMLAGDGEGGDELGMSGASGARSDGTEGGGLGGAGEGGGAGRRVRNPSDGNAKALNGGGRGCCAGFAVLRVGTALRVGATLRVGTGTFVGARMGRAWGRAWGAGCGWACGFDTGRGWALRRGLGWGLGCGRGCGAGTRTADSSTDCVSMFCETAALRDEKDAWLASKQSRHNLRMSYTDVHKRGTGSAARCAVSRREAANAEITMCCSPLSTFSPQQNCPRGDRGYPPSGSTRLQGPILGRRRTTGVAGRGVDEAVAAGAAGGRPALRQIAAQHVGAEAGLALCGVLPERGTTLSIPALRMAASAQLMTGSPAAGWYNRQQLADVSKGLDRAELHIMPK